MGLRKAHGARADSLVRVETMPADELPIGVHAEPQASASGERRPNGTFAPGARTVQSEGGKATKGKTRLAVALGLSKHDAGAAFEPYRKSASFFRRVHCAELARTVGGGVCGPGPSSIVASAALTLAWSRFFSDEAARKGDAELAIKSSTLADRSRTMLLTAHELCAREATARAAQSGPVDPLAKWRGKAAT